MHDVQVPHEPVRAQDPAHLDQDTGKLEALQSLTECFLNSQATFSVKVMVREGYPQSHQLTFQPVTLKALPALPMVRVRSHMPGRLAAQGQREQLLRWG